MNFEQGNQSLIGIFTTDTEFIVQVWDDALERMTGISADEARGKSIAETIPDLEARGLLRRFKRVLEEGTIEILAPAFHRYLIECAPLRASNHFTEMRQRVTVAPLKEKEAILGLLVTIEDVTERMEREIVLNAQLTDADETVRLQAAKAISDERENLERENAEPIIEALSDKDWRVRRELVESLSRRAAPDAIAALLRAMQEKHLDFGVLSSALQVLQATSVKTTETLLEFLRADDADLRMQSALTLGEQGDKRAIPSLIDALGDENVNVRYHAIEALGKLKAKEATEPLLAIIETRDFFLSFIALEALRNIADQATVKRILPLLEDDFLRGAAIETLGAVGGLDEVVSPLVYLLNEDKASAAAVSQALTTVFKRFEQDSSKSARVIEHARRAINEKGIENLLEALENSRDTDLVALIRIAGWVGDVKIREKLAALLSVENVREEAAQALVRHGEAAVDLMIERLKEDDFEVNRTIAHILGQIGDRRAFEPLIGLLGADDTATRQAGVEALKLIAHPGTVSRLCGELGGADSHFREAAIRVIGYFGAKGCEDSILEYCADPDERVRRAAIEQLPGIADERAVRVLIRTLKRDSSRLRAAAANALAQVKSRESVTALREALKDADSWTRYFAIRALGTLRDTESREILIEMAETDAAEHVRAAAGEVVAGLRA